MELLALDELELAALEVLALAAWEVAAALVASTDSAAGVSVQAARPKVIRAANEAKILTFFIVPSAIVNCISFLLKGFHYQMGIPLHNSHLKEEDIRDCAHQMCS